MKILTEMPGPTDGTQWYRGAGPLGEISKSNNDIHIRYEREIDWGTLKASNILFLLRPSTERHYQYIQLAKELGVKVWIDYDDYLLDVPKDNPSHGYYSNPGVKKIIELCIAQADKVSVSTNHLRKLLSELNKNITVVPNAIDQNIIKYKPTKSPNQTIVLWRGTATHQRDLLEYQDEIIQVAKNDERIKFAFVGYNPWFITEKIPRQALYFPPVDLFQFNAALCALRPRVVMVPLHDSDFNRSKSNIAALEGSMAGGAILAPAWEEWSIPGVFQYDSKKTFYNLLQEMITSPAVENAAISSWDFIENNFSLNEINYLRKDIIEKLAK